MALRPKQHARIQELMTNSPKLWQLARQWAIDECDNRYSISCICGRLATGFHTNSCRRFQEAVNRLALQRCEEAIKDGDAEKERLKNANNKT